jgi:putative NADPH-quinone reductase
MKKIFILLGHPNTDTLSGMLADVYEKAAKDAAHEVRRMNIADMQFDPTLHKGYKVIQDYEQDLKTFQENMTWCDHFVIIYPNWWGGMPAILKGLWDRAFMPRFAFHMHKDKFGWDKLLKGRTARLIILTGNPPFLDWLAFGDFTASIKRSILEFAGIRTRITTLGPSENISDAIKARWEKKIAQLARKAK